MNTVPHEAGRRPLSVADFHRMGKAGVFGENERVELIEGEIFSMPPIGIQHSSIVNLLTERFFLAVRQQAIVQVQGPMTLSDLSQPQPDICLFRRDESFYRQVPQRAEDVLLAVEVADSSMEHDRSIKRLLYARHAVPEYWLIGIQKRELIRFAEPEAEGYGKESTICRLEKLSPLMLPNVSVDLTDLF